MVIVTITRWKEKLFLFVAVLLIIAGLSFGLSAVPTGELNEDIFTQPVKVQSDLNEINENSKN